MDHQRRRPRTGVRGAAAGVVLCVALAGLATGLARLVPIAGAPVIGLVLGAVLALTWHTPRALGGGIDFCSHRVLQLAVASFGLQLSLGAAVTAGVRSLPVLLSTLAICLLAGAVLGRLLHVGSHLRTLVSVGTAICGASAIAAVTPLIEAGADEVAYALSTVFVFNAVAVVVFPVVGHALGLSQQAFGLFAGTAINDTSSVAAAGYSYGMVAGQHAIVIKLTRALFIIPICLALALRRRDRVGAAGRTSLARGLPWFLVAFVAASALVSVVSLSSSLRQAFNAVAIFLVTVALAAIGLSTDLRALRRAGPRPLLLGALLWVVVSVSSLAVAALAGLR